MKATTKYKKLLIFSVLLVFLCSFMSAEEQTAEVIPENNKEPQKEEITIEIPVNEKEDKSFLERTNLILQFAPSFYISPESHNNKSNVVNIYYPFTIGALWPNDFFISFQPTLTFFTMEHLWFDKYALPAEIENRTSTTLSFMLNLPAVYTLTLKNKSSFYFSAGFGLFLRFGLLANGVNKSDSGFSGTAEQDLKNINKWFWGNAHWLYLTFGASWLYPISSTIKAGPVLNAYIPIGTLIDQHNFQGLMFSAGIKICI